MARTPTKKKSTSTALTSAQTEIQKELEGLSDTVGNIGGNIIKLDQTRGEYFELPGLGQAESPMDVVIVDYIATNYFYPGKYNKDNIVPPDCFAIGRKLKDMKPSKNSLDIQSDSCAACPNNEFGSDGNGKACKNGRRLAVLPPDAAPDAEIMILNVSPTGLKNFDSYVVSVGAKMGTIPVGVITEVSIVPSKGGQGYTLAFSNPRPNENLEVDFQRRPEAAALITTEPDMTAKAVTAPTRKAPAKKRAASRRR